MIGRNANLVFRRHADKATGPNAKVGFMGKTGLVKKGWWRAFGKGLVGVGTHGKTEFAHTGLLRVKTTAQAMKRGHNSLFGRTTGEVVEKKHMDLFSQIKDMDAAEKLITKYGDDKTLRMWLDGTMPHGIMAVSAPEFAKQVLKEEFSHIKSGNMKNVTNVINSWAVEAIFESLTGTKFNSTIPRDKNLKTRGVRFTEPLRIQFNKGGRAILTYRKNRYDVTDRLNELVA